MAYTPMFEMWRTELEGASFDIVLDLGRGDEYPVADHPWFFGVRIPMADAREDGQPTPLEARRLDTVENRIRETLRDRDALYVGRRTGMRVRDLLFYMDVKPRGIQDRIRASIGMEIVFLSKDDRDWIGYEQLLPTEKDLRQIEDRKIIDDLINLDADVDSEHLLVHTVVTTSTKGAEALERLFQRLELVDVSVEGTKPSIVVTGIQASVLNVDDILHVSWNIERNAAKARGEYIGWTAEPVVSQGYPELDDIELGGESGDEIEFAALMKILAAAKQGDPE